jgi:hypothetical protein
MPKTMTPYRTEVACTACKKEPGFIRTYEGNPVRCPYCCHHRPGWMLITAAHPSHLMTEERSEVRCPGSEPRFYGVRECRVCGLEELSHPAGHFLNGLEYPCYEETT